VPKLFEKAFADGWLTGMVQAAAGETVTYTRGAESITLTATVGQVAFVSTELGGARIQIGDRDYLIKVSDLTFGAPKIGDRITHTVGGNVLVFEIKDPETGEKAWRYSDPDRTEWRIHVNKVG
jgi:hypothetical protein